MRADGERRVPVPADWDVFLGLADVFSDIRAPVQPLKGRRSATWRIQCWDHPGPRAAGSHRRRRRSEPVRRADAHAVDGAHRAAMRAVVLRAAIHIVKGKRVVERNAVELRHRHVVEMTPGRPAVEGFIQPAVISVEQMVCVGGVEDEDVVDRHASARKGR